MATKTQKWNKTNIRQLLEKNDRAVNRGILRIYEYQTREEQTKAQTRESNGVGFNGIDASYGTFLANYILEKRKNANDYNVLTGKFLDRARKMTMKYAGQLAFIANEREARKQDTEENEDLP
jgi:hypothetical protein